VLLLALGFLPLIYSPGGFLVVLVPYFNFVNQSLPPAALSGLLFLIAVLYFSATILLPFWKIASLPVGSVPSKKFKITGLLLAVAFSIINAYFAFGVLARRFYFSLPKISGSSNPCEQGGNFVVYDRLEDALKEPEKVCALALTGQRQVVIPSDISRLTNLTILRLGSTDVTRLPPEFARLTNLTALDLSQNGISEAPQELWSLTSLRSLNLGLNKIIEVSSKISNLQELEELSVGSIGPGYLTQFPPGILKLKNLKRLYLFGKIAVIPPEIGDLSNLEELSLQGNDIKSIPPEIGKLKNLKKLYLHENPIESPLPDTFWELTNLEYLYLPRNNPPNFNFIVPELARLKNLKYVWAPGLTREDQLRIQQFTSKNLFNL